MRIATLLVSACLAACPGKATTPTVPKPVDDTNVRIAIAQAEARRGGGIAELDKLARDGQPANRVLALRGLGRIGGPKALPILIAGLGDPDAAIVVAAASAIGLAMSLDEELAGTPEITAALIGALAKSPEAVIEALGRAGDASAQTALLAQLGGKPEIAAAVAIAFARHGRRKIELSAEARAALNGLTTNADAKVRYAAAHALAREQLPKAEGVEVDKQQAAANALARLLADPDPLVRAQAAQALARRKVVIPHRKALARVMFDHDWRAAVEAVRALAGEASDQSGRHQAALAIMAWLWELDGVTTGEPFQLALREAARLGSVEHTQLLSAVQEMRLSLEGVRLGPPAPTGAHVLIEALRTFVPKPDDRVLANMIRLVGERAAASSKLVDPARAWIVCLATAKAMRAEAKPTYFAMTRCKLPDHLALPLVGELVTAKVGTLEERRTALKALLEHSDARVRVAGMTALASLWREGDEGDHRAVVAMTIAALGSKDGLVAGTATEVAATLYESIDKSAATEIEDTLDAALISRAQIENDPELAAALFGLIAKRKLAAGAGACRAGLAGSPVLVKAAVECMKGLGAPVEPPPIGAATAPPVDITKVIGKRLTWKLETTRGSIAIELRPDIAPWAVAAIATLTGKGFYDGLEMHRVVPNFVVQGGDPTQSGWGGPGFAIPAEPSAGASYVQGGVGMADAGRDSAGSQWFVMHAPAPHLDGRYTWIGAVVSGQNAADSLVIGDRVTRATIETADRP
jgi:peptidyl-prolyl cis-trans isomerase B (cyclophilin B)